MSQVPRNLVIRDLVGAGVAAADVAPPADVLRCDPAGTDGEAVTVTILGGSLDAHAWLERNGRVLIGQTRQAFVRLPNLASTT